LNVRIALIGATGVLGRRLAPRLAAAGHDVAALVRSERGADAARRNGAQPVHGDVLDARSLAVARAGAVVVVKNASAIPVIARPTPQDWAVNDGVRRAGTRNVLEAAIDAGVEYCVHTSVYLVYGEDAGDEPVDESAPLRPASAIRSAVDGEELVRAAGIGWTIVRPGWLYDAGAWHTEQLLGQLRAGTAAVPNDIPAWRSPVHAVDVARAVELVLERRPVGEVFNVADDHPVRTGELLDGLAGLLGGAPQPMRLGQAQFESRLGPGAAAAARRSARLATDRIRALGFAPQYASWRPGFTAVLSES
jgi:nucleoside-diphosphate-sugar epimerase